MPRNDRSFSASDIHRIFCNNLTKAEQVEARLYILLKPCEGNACEWIKSALKVLKPLCLIQDTRLTSIIEKIPFIGAAIARIISLACELEPYLQWGYDLLCGERRPSASQLERPVIDLLTMSFPEIENEIVLISSGSDEEIREVKQEVLEYLDYSSLNLSIP